MARPQQLPCEVWRGTLELADDRTRSRLFNSSKLLAGLTSEFAKTGTLPKVAWCSIASFLKFPQVGRIITAGKWFAACLRAEVRVLGLREIPHLPFGIQWSVGVPMAALVDGHLSPKPFLRKFRALKKLRVDFVPSEDDSSVYYLVVPSAIGLLLETGAFPHLQTLIINLGYDFGECADGSGPSNIFDGSNLDEPFSYHAWVHQLAISIVRAIDSRSTPGLTQVSLVGDRHGGMAYYCSCGLANADLSYMMNRCRDTQTKMLQGQLDRCISKSVGASQPD